MKDSRSKILFVLPSLKTGGAERVMSFVAQNIDKTKFKAEMLIIGFEKDKKFDLKDIDVIYLNQNRVSRAYFAILKTIKKRKPDIVISSIGHVNIMISLVSLLARKPKYIGREASVNSVRRGLNPDTSKIRKYLHNKSFWILDAIICQSEDMRHDLRTLCHIDESRFVTINNPITDGFDLKKKSGRDATIKYITVGSLHLRKGYGRILEALSKVDHSFHYTIIGNGLLSMEIKQLVNSLGLSDQITFIEYTAEVGKYLAKSDLFLNGSYVEGFPNVMLESCSVGTPVLAFNAPGGINEIIKDGLNGYIVENAAAFTNSLNSINKSYNFDKIKVRESVTLRFGKNHIIKQYEDLFTNVANGNPINQ